MEPRSDRHSLLKNNICVEDFSVPGTKSSTGTAPTGVIFLPSAVCRVTLLSRRLDGGIFNFEQIL